MEDRFSILDVKARQIYDSRGFPTLQAEIVTKLGKFRACVPSGASTGKYEAYQLRDNDPKINLGKSVYKAVQNVNTIIREKIIGKDCRSQRELDQLMYKELDGSKNQFGWNKAKLGANAILSVSMAVCRAAAAGLQIPLYAYIRKLLHQDQKNQIYSLPCPAFNVINGGKHGGNELPMQQFMILPTGAKTFKQAMQMGTQVYHILKKIIHKKHGISAVNVGDEGGFAPPILNHIQALQLITQAIQEAGFTGKISIGMDCAASQFFQQGKQLYNLRFKNKQISELINRNQLLEIYKQIISKYPVVSIEDGFDQDDWQGWSSLVQSQSRLQVVGDDLLVTNMTRMQKAKQKNACNALLLKLNQIGTLSQAISACQLAYQYGWGVMVSHRSGETEDSFISHLVVGLGTGQIKTGAPCRSERLAKYNQLLRIQEQVGQKGEYGGKKCFKKLNQHL